MAALPDYRKKRSDKPAKKPVSIRVEMRHWRFLRSLADRTELITRLSDDSEEFKEWESRRDRPQ